MIIKELFAKLGFEVDQGSFNRAKKIIKGTAKAFAVIGTAAGVATGFALRYNSALEQARLTTAGLLKLNLGGEFTDRLKDASSVMDELRKRAAKSTATTAEMVDFMGLVVGPTTAAGLAVEDLAEFTAKAVVAAKAFNLEGTAAFDIQQALTKGVELRDLFANKLLDAVGKTRDEFNKMGKEQRLAILRSALDAEAISDLADAQATSFSGLFSTLKDNIQLFMGQAVAPLFERLKRGMKDAAGWISENEEAIADLADAIGNQLMHAWNFTAAAIETVQVAFDNVLEAGEAVVSWAKKYKRILTVTALAVSVTLIKLTWGMVAAWAAAKIAAVGAAVATGAAWLVAAAPVIAFTALIAGLAWVVQDLLHWFTGGESVIKGFFQRYVNWVEDAADSFESTVESWRDSFVGFFDWIINKIKDIPNKIAQGFSDAADAALDFIGLGDDTNVNLATATEPGVAARFGNGASVAASARAGAGGATKNNNVQASFTINGAPGMDEEQIAKQAAKQFADFFGAELRGVE